MTQEIMDKLAMMTYYTIVDAEQRIHEGIQNNAHTLAIIGITGVSITIILGLIILWNQRKIKKMLREIQNQNADKPQ